MWTGQQGPMEWPAQSPNLMSCGFSVGMGQEGVYKSK